MLLNAYYIDGCDLCEILEFFTIFQKCETRYETVYEEQCQTVNEQQCTTVNEQQCSTVQARLPTDIPRILDSLDALFPFVMCCGERAPHMPKQIQICLKHHLSCDKLGLESNGHVSWNYALNFFQWFHALNLYIVVQLVLHLDY